ncbi:VOC family protein [Streptococcus himalayensis]|uniref:Glyoxalase n=1 Tax=Streptococcus himalayensis TaxID=1888195 RepID=A0A917EI35_9STRE|nr:VOC family protein [Streptococcus himalayensis]GGE37563.1 glyoxalase [Streptococcus himalayensis]
MYPYRSQIYLGEVALYVEDVYRVSQFYQQILGLAVLAETDTEVLLGVGKEGLVRLLPATQGKSKTYGLYHLALLVPERKDLAAIFKRLVENRISMVGGSDHGYSEAIYLEDPEGNGIELYYDKDVIQWDIREDGRIVGVTEELAAQELYEDGAYTEPFQLARGTRMGHVHLSVRESQPASAFYRALLGLEDKFSIPTGSWLASGDYHHHLAVNEWSGKHLQPHQKGQAGLAYFTVLVESKEHLLVMYERAIHLGVSVRWLQSRMFEITDTDGIVVRVGVK